MIKSKKITEFINDLFYSNFAKVILYFFKNFLFYKLIYKYLLIYIYL